MKKSVRAIAALVLALLSSTAFSCADNETEQCAFGACVCVFDAGKDAFLKKLAQQAGAAVNPLPNIITFAGGIVRGDTRAISQGIGGLVLQSSCIGCAVLAQNLNAGDQAFVNSVVGRGFLVFLSTGSPELVVVDLLTSAPRSYALTRPPPLPIPQLPPPVGRVQKNYATDAICAVLAEDKVGLVLGFVDAPTFKSQDSSIQVYPTVDLIKGDTIDFRSSNACPLVPAGQTLLGQGKLRYDYPAIVPGQQTAMKYFLIGSVQP